MVVHGHEHCVFDGVYVVCAMLVSSTVADVVLDSSAGNELDSSAGNEVDKLKTRFVLHSVVYIILKVTILPINI